MAVAIPKCVNFQNTAKTYETSTGKGHRYIPIAQDEFDCRVQTKFRPDILHKDITIKNEQLKSVYNKEYTIKSAIPDKYYRGPKLDNLNYLRTVEEKLIKNPVAPIQFPLSEMKDNFRMNYIEPNIYEVLPPAATTKCYVSKVGCEQQPAIPPHRKGFWRWTDPYLTSYKSQFIPFEDVDGSISAEIATFYNIMKFDFPSASGNKTMYDKAIFKNVLPLRLLSRKQNRVPNYGMLSEVQDKYIRPELSELYPYLQESGEEFEDSLPPGSRFQNQPAPGMYCTDYCNYGGHSTRRVISPKFPKKEIKRTKNCCRLYD